jgi:hypothetical protein
MLSVPAATTPTMIEIPSGISYETIWQASRIAP